MCACLGQCLVVILLYALFCPCVLAGVGECEGHYEYGGPEKAPLRLWVHKYSIVEKRSETGQKKSALLEGSLNKKAKDADIARAVKGLSANHGQLPGMSSDAAAARSLVAAGGGGEAFKGVQVGLNNIAGLAPESASEDEETDVGEGEEGQAANDPEPPEEWLDRDRAILGLEKTLTKALDKQKEGADSVRIQLRSELAQVQALDEKLRKRLRGEEAVATSRLQALDLLFGQDVALSKYLKNFKDGGGASAASSNGGDPAPPCKSHQSLQTFSQWTTLIDEQVWKVKSKDEVEALKKQAGAMQGPIKELVAACKACCGDLARGRKALLTPVKPSKKGQKGAEDTHSGKGEVAGCIFKILGKLTSIVSVNEGDHASLKACEMQNPLVVRSDLRTHATFEQQPCIDSFVKEFQALFLSQQACSGLDKAGRQLSEAQYNIASCRMADLVPWCWGHKPDSEPALSDLMQALGVINGKGSVAVSRGFGGHVRLTLSGSRDIVLTRAAALRDFCPQASIKTAKQTFVCLDEANFSKYQGVIFGGTVTKGDCVYVPPGYIMAERIHTSNHMCLRFGSGAGTLQTLADLQSLGTWVEDKAIIRMADWMSIALED